MTDYVVLQRAADAWAQVGPDRVSARSAQSAITAALASRPNSAQGEFVAVPARSWQPVKVAVETKTQLKFS